MITLGVAYLVPMGLALGYLLGFYLGYWLGKRHGIREGKHKELLRWLEHFAEPPKDKEE